MAQLQNESVLPQEIEADADNAVCVSENEPALSENEPALLRQPTRLPALPSIGGRRLRFASPKQAQAKEKPADTARGAGVYGDPAARWFNYALLALLLICAATSLELLISTTVR